MADEFSVYGWDRLPGHIIERWEQILGTVSLPPLSFPGGPADTKDTRNNPGEVAAKLIQDPLLAAKVMAVANSATMGGRRDVTSLERAVAHLGIELVKGIAAAYYIEGAGRKFPFFLMEHFEFVRKWSAATAVVAANVSAVAKVSEAGTTCAAALLMHLAALYLGMEKTLVVEDYVKQGNEVARLKYEQDKFGITYPILTARLLNNWGLVDELTSLIADSWQPLFVESARGPRDKAVLVLAVSSVLAASHLANRQLDPRAILDRYNYEQLKANLKAHDMFEKVIDCWPSKQMRKDLQTLNI